MDEKRFVASYTIFRLSEFHKTRKSSNWVQVGIFFDFPDFYYVTSFRPNLG